MAITRPVCRLPLTNLYAARPFVSLLKRNPSPAQPDISYTSRMRSPSDEFVSAQPMLLPAQPNTDHTTRMPSPAHEFVRCTAVRVSADVNRLPAGPQIDCSNCMPSPAHEFVRCTAVRVSAEVKSCWQESQTWTARPVWPPAHESVRCTAVRVSVELNPPPVGPDIHCTKGVTGVPLGRLDQMRNLGKQKTSLLNNLLSAGREINFFSVFCGSDGRRFLGAGCGIAGVRGTRCSSAIPRCVESSRRDGTRARHTSPGDELFAAATRRQEVSWSAHPRQNLLTARSVDVS
jgi:hypothetical protein